MTISQMTPQVLTPAESLSKAKDSACGPKQGAINVALVCTCGGFHKELGLVLSRVTSPNLGLAVHF